MQGHHAQAEQRTMNLRTIPQSEQNNAYQNKLISEKIRTYTDELLFGNLEICSQFDHKGKYTQKNSIKHFLAKSSKTRNERCPCVP
jgi:hypothetical protein